MVKCKVVEAGETITYPWRGWYIDGIAQQFGWNEQRARQAFERELMNLTKEGWEMVEKGPKGKIGRRTLVAYWEEYPSENEFGLECP